MDHVETVDRVDCLSTWSTWSTRSTVSICVYRKIETVDHVDHVDLVHVIHGFHEIHGFELQIVNISNIPKADFLKLLTKAWENDRGKTKLPSYISVRSRWLEIEIVSKNVFEWFYVLGAIRPQFLWTQHHIRIITTGLRVRNYKHSSLSDCCMDAIAPKTGYKDLFWGL